MKATGIVRRIDDLGRVVIPKEIRRTLKIREGDPLEIYIDRGAVIFQKYQAMDDFETQSRVTCDTFQRMDSACAIFDRDGEPFMSNTRFRSMFSATMPNLPEDLIGCNGSVQRKPMIFMPIIDDGEMLGTLVVETDNCKMVEFAVRNLIGQAEIQGLTNNPYRNTIDLTKERD